MAFTAGPSGAGQEDPGPSDRNLPTTASPRALRANSTTRSQVGLGLTAVKPWHNSGPHDPAFYRRRCFSLTFVDSKFRGDGAAPDATSCLLDAAAERGRDCRPQLLRRIGLQQDFAEPEGPELRPLLARFHPAACDHFQLLGLGAKGANQRRRCAGSTESGARRGQAIGGATRPRQVFTHPRSPVWPFLFAAGFGHANAGRCRVPVERVLQSVGGGSYAEHPMASR
jgi:hypothetical protein